MKKVKKSKKDNKIVELKNETKVDDGIYELPNEVKREVDVPISDEEAVKIFKEAGEVYGDLAELERQLLEKQNEIKPQIKTKQEELEALNRKMHKRTEKKTVLCKVQKDYKENLVYYLYEGNIVDKRIMEACDKQIEVEEKSVEINKAEPVGLKEGRIIKPPSDEKLIKSCGNGEIIELKKETKKATKKDWPKVGDKVYWYPMAGNMDLREVREVKEILDKADDNIILVGLPEPVGIINISEV